MRLQIEVKNSPPFGRFFYLGKIMSYTKTVGQWKRAECLAKENKQLVWKQQQLEEANARNLALLIEANSKLNDRVTNNATKEIQKIHAADAALRRDPDGLRIPAQTCRADPVPATTDSAGVDSGRGRVDWLRLPGRTENDLYDYALKPIAPGSTGRMQGMGVRHSENAG